MDPFNVNNICHMTDNELQSALAKYGESVETITSETRCSFENKLKKHYEKDRNELQKSSCLSSGNNKPEPVLQQKIVRADTYYGVFIPSHLLTENIDVKKVHTEKNEGLNLLKRYQGSRFKCFPTYNEALYFSKNGPTVPNSEKLSKDSSALLNPEKPSPFRGPKSQELVKFRKAIEKGNHDYFEECVSSNPRFLVSSGDTPSILQEGSRYNALHIACRNDQPEFCKKILASITSPKFFQRLYPDDSSETSERRCDFLLDLYLNTPDKGFNETPLHFACKHGSPECVKYILSYPACDNGRLNKYGQTPIDVIGSRTKKPDKSLNKSIRDMFDDLFFVPVLRDRDNCHAPRIGPPWSPVAKKEEPSPSSISYVSPPNSHNPLSPLFKVKGYAGPMSPQKADDFYSRWRRSAVPSPSRSAKAKVAALRIADHEKGLERIGRNLASELSVGWVEYWDFLEQFINIASMEGLQKLEQYLKDKYREVVENRNQEEADQTLTLLASQIPCKGDSPSLVDSSLKSSLTQIHEDESIQSTDLTKSSLSSIGGLCQDLEALRLNASLSPNPETENIYRVQKGLPLKRKHSSTPNAYSFKKKVNQNFSSSPLRPQPSSFTPNHISDDDLHDHNNSIHSDGDDLEDSLFSNSNSAAEQYNFAVQSTRISSLRLSSILNEISNSISYHIGPDLRIARILRNKMKSEVRSLRKVLVKCLLTVPSTGETTPPDFHFVHVFLAAKTVEHLMVNVSASASVLFLASKTLQLLTANIDALEESSSDEEDQTDFALASSMAEAGFFEEEERKEEQAHFRCVARALEKALEVGMRLMKEGKDEEAKVDLRELDECQCAWHWSSSVAKGMSPTSLRCHPVDVQGINDSINNNIKKKTNEGSGGRLSRAQSFLHRILFGKSPKKENKTADVDKEDMNQSKSEVFPVFKKSVMKQLSFEEDQEENGHAEENDAEEDTESFTSALSSFEDDQSMGTPEEQVKVYINGTNPTKDDTDVFVAIDGLDVNETIYPHVGQWLRLIQSHPKETRERWPSACCRYDHQAPFPSSCVRTSSPLQDHPNDTSIRKNIFPQSPPP